MTGSPTPILSKAQVRAAMPASRTRPLFIIDIAVPRDVDPKAGEIEQVFLYNIDDLQAIVRENLERRGAEVGRAEQIVEEEVQKFASWQRSRDAVPTIVALRQRFEQVRKAGAGAARAEARRAAAGSAGARRRDDAPARREAAAAPDRAAEERRRSAHLSQYADALTRLFGLDEKDRGPVTS